MVTAVEEHYSLLSPISKHRIVIFKYDLICIDAACTKSHSKVTVRRFESKNHQWIMNDSTQTIYYSCSCMWAFHVMAQICVCKLSLFRLVILYLKIKRFILNEKYRFSIYFNQGLISNRDQLRYFEFLSEYLDNKRNPLKLNYRGQETSGKNETLKLWVTIYFQYDLHFSPICSYENITFYS